MNKRIFGYGLTALLCGSSMAMSSASFAAGGAEQLDVAVGSQQSLAGGHTLRRVAIGDPSVADVLIIKGDKTGGVLLIGKSPGTTTSCCGSRARTRRCRMS